MFFEWTSNELRKKSYHETRSKKEIGRHKLRREDEVEKGVNARGERNWENIAMNR
jgi:hypothetical protein